MVATTAPTDQGLIEELRSIVGDRGLVLGEDVGLRSCDPFRAVPPGGSVIVRPSSTDEVSRVLAWCSRRGQRVVTHGGRTGVAGGAYADADELVLSMERMARLEEIDTANGVAVVECGMTLQAVQEAAEREGLFYPVDLGAKGTATIGGNIVTNAGGNRVIRWGMTRQNVLGLEAVLADGTIVSAMNRLLKNNTGYDVKQLFIGSEGTLGVVTRAVLRLFPLPVTQMVAFIAAPDFAAVLALLAQARKLPTLSAFEVMWRDYYAIMAASGTGRDPVAADQPYYVLIEAMGYSETLDAPVFEAFLERAYEAGLIADAVTAQSGRQVNDLWQVREGSEVLVREMSPFLSFDVSVDIRQGERFVGETYAALRSRYPALRTVTLGHLGDNNLHLGIHVGPETLTEADAIEHCVYDLVRRHDGALTAEHGVGRFKRQFLPAHVSTGAMETMRRMRSVMDPASLLNRSVLF